MGYRTYIGRISKENYEKIKDKSLEQIYDGLDIEDDYVGIYDLIDESLYELGKYTEFDDKKFYKPFFTNNRTQERYSEDNEIWLVGKDYLEHVINHYKEKVQSFYDKMLNPFFDKSKYPRSIGEPSEFLNSIKTEYGHEKKRTYDFSLITQEQQNALFEIIEHLRSMRNEWFFGLPYDLEDGIEVTTSWKYEYAIFELVRIYKTFDWENDYLIYYGY